MVRFVERYFTSSDGRGAIEGLINFGKWEELNYVSSDQGVIRGNHYHKTTREGFIILSGKINVTFQKIKNGVPYGKMLKHTVRKGHVFIIEPMVNHVFYVEENAEWINILSSKINNIKPDIIKINNNKH